MKKAMASQQVMAESSFESRLSDCWFSVLPLHLLFPLPGMLSPQISAWPPPAHPSGLSSNVTSPDFTFLCVYQKSLITFISFGCIVS